MSNPNPNHERSILGDRLYTVALSNVRQMADWAISNAPETVTFYNVRARDEQDAIHAAQWLYNNAWGPIRHADAIPAVTLFRYDLQFDDLVWSPVPDRLRYPTRLYAIVDAATERDAVQQALEQFRARWPQIDLLTFTLHVESITQVAFPDYRNALNAELYAYGRLSEYAPLSRPSFDATADNQHLWLRDSGARRTNAEIAEQSGWHWLAFGDNVDNHQRSFRMYLDTLTEWQQHPAHTPSHVTPEQVAEYDELGETLEYRFAELCRYRDEMQDENLPTLRALRDHLAPLDLWNASL